MLYPPNITAKVLTPNTYSCNLTAVTDSPWQIICLESGTITISPIRGDRFNWSPSTGDKINVIPKKISISSGLFNVFYGKYKGCTSSGTQEIYFIIDETGDNFVDENGDKFTLK